MTIRKYFGWILAVIVLLGVVVYLLPYKRDYMYWELKSKGYPDLYRQLEEYSFTQAPKKLTDSFEWVVIATDEKGDGDIPNWPDAKELSMLVNADTLWFRYTTYNNIDLNEPMVSIALYHSKNQQASPWYGTIQFNYNEMIAVGYFRENLRYKGYNMLAGEKGVCRLQYDIESNSLFLGVPTNLMVRYQGIEFIASIGLKGLWNDDFDGIQLNRISI